MSLVCFADLRLCGDQPRRAECFGNQQHPDIRLQRHPDTSGWGQKEEEEAARCTGCLGCRGCWLRLERTILYHLIQYEGLLFQNVTITIIKIKWSDECMFPNPLLHVCYWIKTHWGRDKMDAISQTTFSSAFSWMKMFEFRLKFHWSFFLRVKLTKIQHWFR